MRRHLLIAALPLAALSAPVLAQDGALPEEGTERLQDLSSALSDPARQQEIADTVSVLAEVLLDLPLAPIVGPLAEAAEDLTNEELPSVDPDMTLRRMAPEAGDVSAQIQDNLPQAMDSLANATSSLAALLPALREMADRLKDALPQDR